MGTCPASVDILTMTAQAMPSPREFVFGPWRAVSVLGITQILSWGALFYPPVLTPLIAADHGWSRSFAMAGFSVALFVGGLPGAIIIDTPNKFLYLIEDDGKALRYGIGVGRPGFLLAGVKTITAKREWPDWRPPTEMIARQPGLPRFMPGGIDNPLGARALYLGSSLYRIHGSNEPWTIGTNVSSGCIRMRNEDVIDLYQRVKVGTKVVVI